MTLIFEIAAGIVLGVAIIAIIAVFWKALAVALIGLIGLVLSGIGIAVLYSVCGSWENVGIVVAVLGFLGGAAWLIEFFNNHDEYGPSFRAMGSAIVFCSAAIIILCAVFFQVIVNSSIEWYYFILPIVAIFLFSVRVSFRRYLQRELNAAHD